MTKASTVAYYLTDRVHGVTAMQLQMLLYYAQGCNLALQGQPLFSEPIEASANGPVVRRVFELRRGAARGTSTDDGFPYDTKQMLNMIAGTLGSLDSDDLVESAH